MMKLLAVVFILLSLHGAAGLRRNLIETPILTIESGKTAIISCCINTKEEEFDGFYDNTDKKIQAWTNPNKFKTEVGLGTDPNEICPTFSIRNVDVNDLGDYACKTAAEEEIVFSLNLKASLQVRYPDQVFLIDSEATEIKVNIICSALPHVIWSRRGNGKFENIAVYNDKDGKQTQGLPKYEISTKDGSLAVNNVNHEDIGLYQIQMIDGESEQKEIIKIKVEDRPWFNANKTLLTSTKDSHHTLTIVAKSDPAADLICKIKDDSFEDGKLPSPTLKHSGENVTAVFEFISNSSYVTCEATNKHGTDKLRIELVGTTIILTTPSPAPVMSKKIALIIGSSFAGVIVIILIGCIICAICRCRKGNKNIEEGIEEHEIVNNKQLSKKKRTKDKTKNRLDNPDDSDVYAWLQKETSENSANTHKTKEKNKKHSVTEPKKTVESKKISPEKQRRMMNVNDNHKETKKRQREDRKTDAKQSEGTSHHIQKKRRDDSKESETKKTRNDDKSLERQNHHGEHSRIKHHHKEPERKSKTSGSGSHSPGGIKQIQQETETLKRRKHEGRGEREPVRTGRKRDDRDPTKKRHRTHDSNRRRKEDHRE